MLKFTFTDERALQLQLPESGGPCREHRERGAVGPRMRHAGAEHTATFIAFYIDNTLIANNLI